MVLEAFADLVGCTVVHDVPISGYWGEYSSAGHMVRLHPELSGIQLGSVMAHELGHAAHRHESSTAVTERQADALADWLRIPLCDFLRATQAHETVQGVAHELGVLPSDARRYAERFCAQK